MYFLGIDLGSSSIKLSVLDAKRSVVIASVNAPELEMPMHTPEFRWAEQHPLEQEGAARDTAYGAGYQNIYEQWKNNII